MKIEDIISTDCEYMKNVSVHVVSIYGTVCIKDTTGEQEDIFMQGDEGNAFISEANRLYNEVQTVSLSECYLHLARPYVDCIWS